MIYHYTNEKGLLGILNSKKIWLVSSREMSDITDRFYANLFATIALLKSDDEDIMNLRDNLTVQDILDVNMKTFEVEFYSASFCNRSDNEYLWQNYADSSKGFCIEIDYDVLRKYMNDVLVKNYDKLDEYDEILESDKDILKPREVSYGYPIDTFLDVIRLTKNIFGSNEHIENQNIVHESYRNWLLFTLLILSGIVKGTDFKNEEEIRLLFQNRYSEEYIKEHMIYSLNKMSLSKGLEELGLLKEAEQGQKKRFELNLVNNFNSELIPTIIVGEEYNGDFKTLKDNIIKAGLTNTKVIDKKGNIY